jgi:phage-related baseplate assembly protein/phage baseplate assembly protein W
MTGTSRMTAAALADTGAHIVQSIGDILSTPVGSRVLRRAYGSRLADLFGRPVNRQTLLEIYAATAEALARWEPRIRLTRVQVLEATSTGATLGLHWTGKSGAGFADVEAIFARKRDDLLALAPELAGVLALESEPLTKYLQRDAWDEYVLRQAYNDRTRAMLLAFATAGDLDHLAALFGVQRQVVVPGDATAIPPVPPVMESDTDLRRRVQLAPDALSVAGPRGAYVAHALAADPDVKDVAVTSPSPGLVRVHVLARSGDGAPSPELLSLVVAAVNAETVRPLTDQVEVVAAALVNVAIEATIVLMEGPSSAAVMSAVDSALDAYLDAQRRLGGDITRSGLMAALHQSGVHRVTLTQPAADVLLATHQAPKITSVTLAPGGRDA